MNPISNKRSSERVMFFGRLIGAPGGGPFRGCGCDATTDGSVTTMRLGLGGDP